MAAKNTRAKEPRHPRVTSTETTGQAKTQTSSQTRGQHKEKQAAVDARPAWLAKAIAAIEDKLLTAGRTTLAQYMLRDYPDAQDRFGFEEKATRLRIYLDLVQLELQDSPELRLEFERHGLMLDYLRISKTEVVADPVADEIAKEIRIKWADRNSAPYRAQPWPWLKRADLFVAKIYERWLSANTLRLRHLAHDQQLYNAYKTTVRRHPERDLHLLQDAKAEHEQSRPISDRRSTHIRIPVSKLSEEERKRRREQETHQKRNYRAKKRP
jgi:hypothetical protein